MITTLDSLASLSDEMLEREIARADEALHAAHRALDDVLWSIAVASDPQAKRPSGTAAVPHTCATCQGDPKVHAVYVVDQAGPELADAARRAEAAVAAARADVNRLKSERAARRRRDQTSHSEPTSGREATT